jgi:transposase-like protein
MKNPKMKCPECGSDMKQTKGGFYACQSEKCKGYYIPQSCFAITQ